MPLSSDALCRFGHHDRHVHNPEVKAATTRLLQVVIPDFAKNLDATASNEMTIASIVTQVRSYQPANLTHICLHSCFILLREIKNLTMHLLVFHI